jgi:hypothetical protein
VSKPSASRRICTSCVVAAVALIGVALLAFSPVKHRAAHAASSPSLASQSKTVPPSARERVKASFAGLPLGFEQNYGQTDPQVKYMAHANGYTLFLTNHDAVFAFHAKSPTSQRPTGHGPLALQAKSESQAQPNSEAAVRMQLVGGNSNALLTASDQLPGKSNYIRGKDPRNWHTDVSHYARVSYTNIYPGINLAYHGEQSRLEFDFIVAPRSTPAPIDLAFNGAQHLATDASGNLIVSSGAGDVVLHKPVAYQRQDGTRQPVDARFVLKAANQVRFELGSYDRSRELVIDPTVTYATYLGGSTEDDGYAIAFDSTGAAYVTGQTNSSTFPKVGGLTPNVPGDDFDAFVTKFLPNGSNLVYSTYVDGGSSDTGNSSGNAIAVDPSCSAPPCSVFVAGGTTSTTLPATAGAFHNSNAGGLDAFVFELNPAGSALTSLTYLGGMGSDVANGIAVDASRNVYVVGATSSSDFPTANPIQPSLVSTSDAFVTKLNPALGALVYSTWLGGGSADFASAVALDSSNNVYVTGGTGSTTFPITPGVFQPACNSCTGTLYNAFVTVINSAGSGYIYSTYLGGTQNDEGFGIAVDSSGDAYVTGETNSSTFQATGSALQGAYGGGSSDAFVSELNPTGTALVYWTFLGGSANDVGTSIALDQGDNAYVTGQTGSTNFPTTANATQSTLNRNGLAGNNDAFVSELNSAGSALIFSTFLGGAQNENTPQGGGSGALGGIAVDPKGDSFYVTGNTWSTNFPTVLPYQANNASLASEKINAFVANYSQQAFTVSASPLSPASVTPASSAMSTVTIAAVNGFTGSVSLSCAVSGPSNAVSPPTCTFATNPVAGGSGSSGLTVSTTLTTSGGVYAITVIGTDPSSGMTHSATVDLTVNAANFTISATPPTPVAPGGTATSTVTLTSFDGYASPVNLTCSVAGSGTPLSACTVTGSTSVVPTSGGATSTVTITTTAPGAAMVRPRKFFYAMWLPVAGLSLLGIGFKTSPSQRKKLLGFVILGMVMTGLFLLPSCGGSSRGGGGGGGSCAAAPSAPTGVAASGTTMTGTTLNWTAATVGANCSVSSYTVYQNGTSIGTASSTTFNVTGLTPSTTYGFTVAATDAAGTSPQSSPAVSVTTLTAGTPAATYTITITGMGTDANTIKHSTTVNLTVN